MKTILAAAAALSVQAASLDEFYKFKPETTWTYARFENGKERKIVGRVTGETDGRVRLDWKDYEKDGSLRESSIVTWSVQEGVLIADARNADDPDQPVLAFAVLKGDTRKDDRWTSAAGEVVHQGTVEVTVPAGTYKNALHTQLRLGEGGKDGKVDFYLVPKVGLVKVDIDASGAEANRFELVEFKEPKK